MSRQGATQSEYKQVQIPISRPFLLSGETTVTICIILLAGSLLIGLGHCFLVPAFEGFDETAHYSYLSQLVDTKRIPNRTNGFISQQIDEYAKNAPLIYTYGPEQRQTRVIPKTYADFFQSPAGVLQKARDYAHGTSWQKQTYSSNGTNDWEVQHPPLYYVLLAPVFAATKHLPFFFHFAVLRFVSYLFAWLSLAVAVFWLLKNRAKLPNADIFALGISLWPCIVGSWYSGVARLGNDSLCLVWISIAVLAMLSKPSIVQGIIVGLALAFGALTKGYFAAIGPGILLYYAAQWIFRERKKKEYASLAAAVIIIILFVAVAGWWYWLSCKSTGYLLGSAVEVESSQSGGSLLSIFTTHFSLPGFMKSFIGLIISGLMPGTWSLVRPQSIFPLVNFILICLVFYHYAKRIEPAKVFQSEWLPVWFFVPLLAAIVYHNVFLFAISLNGWGPGVGGYYMNILAVPLGMILGLGLAGALSSKRSFMFAMPLIAYGIAFFIWMNWANVLVYAGIVTPTPGRHFFGFPQELPSFLGIIESVHRLKVLTYPIFAIASWTLGMALEISGLVIVARYAEIWKKQGNSFIR
jgi:hypothetical protein